MHTILEEEIRQYTEKLAIALKHDSLAIEPAIDRETRGREQINAPVLMPTIGASYSNPCKPTSIIENLVEHSKSLLMSTIMDTNYLNPYSHPSVIECLAESAKSILGDFNSYHVNEILSQYMLKNKVFISCHNSRYGEAKTLKQFLESNGLICFVADTDIKLTNMDQWRQALAGAMLTSSIFMLLISPEYEESAMCLQEATFASARRVGCKNLRILPVCIGGIDPGKYPPRIQFIIQNEFDAIMCPGGMHSEGIMQTILDRLNALAYDVPSI